MASTKSPVPDIKRTGSLHSDSSEASSDDASYSSDHSTSSIEGAAAIMSPSDLDYTTHGDLRGASREFTRDRSLRKKSRTHSSPALASPAVEALSPLVQPVIPGETEKKPKKMSKKQQLRSHENIKKSNKREDRRKSVTMDRRKSNDDSASPEGGDVAVLETGVSSLNIDKPPKHRRKSSHSHNNKPPHNRKPSASSGLVKSPGSPSLSEQSSSSRPSISSPKQSQQNTQYHVDEGIHERAGDLEAQMRRMAQIEAQREWSKGGRLTRGLEEIDRRQRERRREEALRGVVEGAVEKWEGRAD